MLLLGIGFVDHRLLERRRLVHALGPGGVNEHLTSSAGTRATAFRNDPRDIIPKRTLHDALACGDLEALRPAIGLNIRDLRHRPERFSDLPDERKRDRLNHRGEVVVHCDSGLESEFGQARQHLLQGDAHLAPCQMHTDA
jgi:hypothetical protein